MKAQKQQEKVHVYTLETSVAYNPFLLVRDGLREGEVSGIKFFKVENGIGEVIASCRWFTIMRGTRKKMFIDSNNDFNSLELPYTNIPYRRKESFDKDLAFYLKTPNKYGGGSYLELYLNVSELAEFKIEKSEPESMYDGSETHTYDIVTFKVKGTSRRTEWDGTENCVRTACFTCNHLYTKTTFGLMCEKIASIIGHDLRTNTNEVAHLIKKGALDQVIQIYDDYRKNVSK